MIRKLRASLKTVVQYPYLNVQKYDKLRILMIMSRNYGISTFKFIAGCVTGNAFLCVNALYSFLIGAAKRHYFTFIISKEKKNITSNRLFLKMGVIILLAGITYGVYMGRLIAYPRLQNYALSIGVLMIFVCLIDIIFAVCSLLQVSNSCDDTLSLLGRKFVVVAAALPALSMAQIGINSLIGGRYISFGNGVLGAAIGGIQFFIGAGMIFYAEKRKRNEDAV